MYIGKNLIFWFFLLRISAQSDGICNHVRQVLSFGKAWLHTRNVSEGSNSHFEQNRAGLEPAPTNRHAVPYL
ncbi:MAG: hypothetical protein DM484_17765 [Candidatus Methylumidiphilus alinenensis]|uniref:Uncharacterized protein n=1 Tax=Candidatus Methylumidiphilus alinenensis TaxID=2202197 RepID=A0A2W4R752_9GAMM|nr:MAG: hypothetical protein DM484_17765 [Candidatus Methylumidiphilus alinenensis]